ncbi:hypothetical protein GFS31_18570 [Leptolyngbya sp. BL0902]|uniref:DUF4340 domain-containing protein n=1 Tax=Leptolyngbya sp. BL0902 TaxID=1115757 RepID=UPI0018E8B81B|nr:DUF4340 domain-containing protein [Leptolyngbya sp. BL0902]QQE65172.1 hypothetical protein GFS31_18570 [Leptolyngbya sp. BL0902]
MKLKRGTVVLVGVALLLGAGVLMGESQQRRQPASQVQAGRGAIFRFAETDVATVTVERDGEVLVFEGDGAGNWQMIEPENRVAEPGAVAFLLSRLITDSPLQRVTMAADQLADFGLDQPLGQVTVVLQDGTEYVLILGGRDFSGNANYAIVDPGETWPPASPTGEYEVLVVTRDVANGINRPLEEWKMPVEGEGETSPGASSDNDPALGDPALENLPLAEPSLEIEIPADRPGSDGATEADPAEPNPPNGEGN